MQGALVPKITHGPFLTLSVRNGHKLKTEFLGSQPISKVKVEFKSYNQHYIKHDEDKNSQFKTIFWN